MSQKVYCRINNIYILGTHGLDREVSLVLKTGVEAKNYADVRFHVIEILMLMTAIMAVILIVYS